MWSVACIFVCVWRLVCLWLGNIFFIGSFKGFVECCLSWRGTPWINITAVERNELAGKRSIYRFGKCERKRLFQKINDLPTVFEVVTGAVKQTKDQIMAA